MLPIQMRDEASIYITPPMSGAIKIITYIIWTVPFLLVYLAVAKDESTLFTVAIFFILLMTWVWLWMRPTHYMLDSKALTIVWPLRKYVMLKSSISGVRILDKKQIKEELGLAIRIGVGGLFGGFGLLWTRKRGLIRFYITRLDDFIMIDRLADRSLLISVDDPQRMLKELVPGDSFQG